MPKSSSQGRPSALTLCYRGECGIEKPSGTTQSTVMSFAQSVESGGALSRIQPHQEWGHADNSLLRGNCGLRGSLFGVSMGRSASSARTSQHHEDMEAKLVHPVVIQERVNTAIAPGESHFREFKSARHGPPTKKATRPMKELYRDIAEALVAFANADGGELIVGIEDDGTVSGLADFTEDELHALETAYRSYVHPDTPLSSVRVARTELDGRSVLYFSVPKGVEAVHQTSDSRCVVRRDLETVPVALERLRFDRQEQISREYDRAFIDGPQADALDLSAVAKLANRLSPGMTPEKCLQHLDLAEYISGGLRLRRAALLLFAKEPLRWHPRLQTRILKIKRYRD